MSNPFSPLHNSNPNSPVITWAKITNLNGNVFVPYPATTQLVGQGYGDGGYGTGPYGGQVGTIVNQNNTQWSTGVTK